MSLEGVQLPILLLASRLIQVRQAALLTSWHSTPGRFNAGGADGVSSSWPGVSPTSAPILSPVTDTGLCGILPLLLVA